MSTTAMGAGCATARRRSTAHRQRRALASSAPAGSPGVRTTYRSQLECVPGVNDTPRRTSPNFAVRTVRNFSHPAGVVAFSRSLIITRFVRVSAGVAAPANGRGDRPDCGGAVATHLAGQGPQAVGGGRPGSAGHRVDTGRIAGHRVRHTEVQAVLEGVGEVSRAAVEHPLLEPGLRLRRRCGVDVGIGRAVVGVVPGALIRHGTWAAKSAAAHRARAARSRLGTPCPWCRRSKRC